MPSAFLIPAMTLFTLALWLTLWPLLILWRQVRNGQNLSAREHALRNGFRELAESLGKAGRL